MSHYPDQNPAERFDEFIRPRPIVIPAAASKPVVTYTILGLTILVFLAQSISNLIWKVDLPVYFGGKINEFIRAGELWRLITPVLLHGGIFHIGFNMYALYIIGAGMEQRMGHARFLLLYLLGGFAGNVLSFMFTSGVSVGASTAIFGLLGAEGIFLYHNRDLLGPQGKRALNNVIGLAVINLLIGLQPGIDNWGHIGGLLGGLLFMWVGGPRWRLEGLYPYLQITDERGIREAILGAALVILVFGALTMVGMYFPIVQ